jgi:hypothetical protein
MAESADNPGCAYFCKAGEALADSDSEQMIKDAHQFVTDNPCEHVKHGDCRLVEFLIQKAREGYITE